jgi:hypothetical protein
MRRIEVNGVTVPQGVHRDVAPLVAWLMAETMLRGYPLVAGWCWGYANRPIGGTSTPSNHSWGLAVDLNAPTNPRKRPLTTNMPGWMPDLWRQWGFGWGGAYTSATPDAMHYEFLGTPADALRYVGQLRKPAINLTVKEAEVVRISGEHISTARIGKGFVATNESGAVYAFQTSYHGAYNTLKPEQRQGERKIIGIVADTVNAPDGYTQLADDGALYTFPL